jgi:hypothetical protein
MVVPHFAHVCVLLNSSEKISFSAPQLLHLQTNDLRSLKDSYPGQCSGVVVMINLLLQILIQLFHMSWLYARINIFHYKSLVSHLLKVQGKYPRKLEQVNP